MKKINNINKIIVVFISIGLLFCIYTFYKDYILWNGEKRDYYSTFYIITISFTLILVSSLFFKKKVKENFVTILISLIISVYLCEVFITFLKNKFNFDLVNKYQFTLMDEYKKELKSDPNSVVIFAPSNNIEKRLDFFPLGGISLRNTLYCNENDYWTRYFSDDYGFYNPKKDWKNKSFDIILVGDSFGHGACVNFEGTIHGYLENNFDTLNLSYSGNGALIKYATLREYLPFTKTKNILWIFFEGNDMGDLLYEYTNPTLKKYINDEKYSQNLINRQKEIDNFYLKKIKSLQEDFYSPKKDNENKTNFISNFSGFIKLTNLRQKIRTIDFLVKIKKKKKFDEIFYKINSLTKSRKINLCFVYLPEWTRFTDKNYDNFDLNLAKRISKKNNVPFVNTIEALKKIDNIEDYYGLKYDHSGGHFNELGYKIVVDEILKNKDCIIK